MTDDDLARILRDGPTPEDVRLLLDRIETDLDSGLADDERARLADEAAADELRSQGQHAHEVTRALLDRAWDVRRMRAAKAERHLNHQSRDGQNRPVFRKGRPTVPKLGRQATEMMEWLIDDLAAGVELVKPHGDDA
jgi:hypothetical protein